MDRILIIGINGSGKSTFANKLSKKLNRKVIHLDSLHYKSGWQKKFKVHEEWKQHIRDLVTKDKWIIDGYYNSTLKIRLDRADTVIFFNYNKLVCLYRVLKRALDRTQPFDKPKGNYNKLSWNLIKKLINFPRRHVLGLLEECKNKKILIVHNDKETTKLLNIL